MSRHEYDEPGVTVAIGWDQPLATYYLQVWSKALQSPDMTEDEREAPQIWLGNEYAQYPQPDELLALARRHMPSLPEDLDQELREDRGEAPPG